MHKIKIGILLFVILIIVLKLNFLKDTFLIVLLFGIYELIYNYILTKNKTYSLKILILISIILIIISIVALSKLTINNFLKILIYTNLNDIGQQFSGKAFGKTHITKISPNKTLEGYMSGLILLLLLGQPILLFILNIFGDLYFSYIKRKMKIKDYSSILLSHGGILDRFDSLIFPLIISML